MNPVTHILYPFPVPYSFCRAVLAIAAGMRLWCVDKKKGGGGGFCLWSVLLKLHQTFDNYLIYLIWLVCQQARILSFSHSVIELMLGVFAEKSGITNIKSKWQDN